jgi:signal transduction histidine kinase
MIGRTLYDIAQLLESAEGADQRVRGVLGLLHHLVPYDQCALLEARLGFDPHVVAVPEATPAEEPRLTLTLVNLFWQFVDTPESTRAAAPVTRPEGVHLAVPLVGLDEVIGLLLVRSSTSEYTDEHVRDLSMVAATLAAYLTTLRAQNELVEIARARDEARDAAEAANQTKDHLLALMANELKTPLAAILAWTQVLRSATDDIRGRGHALDEIERNVHTQASLVGDILGLARDASTALRLNLHIVRPKSWLEATLEGLRRTLYTLGRGPGDRGGPGTTTVKAPTLLKRRLAD